MTFLKNVVSRGGRELEHEERLQPPRKLSWGPDAQGTQATR